MAFDNSVRWMFGRGQQKQAIIAQRIINFVQKQTHIPLMFNDMRAIDNIELLVKNLIQKIIFKLSLFRIFV